MGFKGFLDKTLSVTGKVTQKAVYYAYLAGKYILKEIMDNGVSMVSRGILDSLEKEDLSDEEKELVKEARRLQKRTDRKREHYNDLIREVNKLEKLKGVYEEIIHKKEELISAESKEEKDKLSIDLERLDSELVKNQNKISGYSERGSGKHLSNVDIEMLDTQIQEKVEKASSISEEHKEYESELKEKMKEIKELRQKNKDATQADDF